jgi:hypothetical protein
VITSELAVSRAHAAFDGQGRLIDPELTRQLQRTLTEMAAAVQHAGKSYAA